MRARRRRPSRPPSQAGELDRAHAFEYACAQYDIDRRLSSPSVHGPSASLQNAPPDQVAAVKRYFYQTHDQLRSTPHQNFVETAYKFALTASKASGPPRKRPHLANPALQSHTIQNHPLHQIPGLTSRGSGSVISSASATGGDGGAGNFFSPAPGGGASSASSTATSGSGRAELFATATGGAGGLETMFVFSGSMGGDALSTADLTALHGGVATASATATGGAPGGGSSLPAAPGAANATSTATTDHGALAQALSTETGSVTNQSGGAPSAAQSTAKTSFAGASVTSTAVASSFFNDGTATTNAIAQGGSGQDLVNPGQTAYTKALLADL